MLLGGLADLIIDGYAVGAPVIKQALHELRDQLLKGVGFVAEPLTELPIEAVLGARPVSEFVKQDRIVRLGGIAG